MLQEGVRAPEFTLPDQDGKDVSLSNLLGQGMLILYFYPADFTPGCTREACMIRDLHGDLSQSGFTVVGVSPQPPETHRAFREKYRLHFPLLSDSDKSVARMYEVVGRLFGIRRATFLIGRGRIIRAALMADFRIGKHEDFIRAAIAAGAR